MTVTKENIVEKHLQCINDVLNYDYYVSRFKLIANQYHPLEMTDCGAIHTFWNEVWFSLPDSPVIHRHPFNLICDLAEGSYLEPEDE